MKIAISGAGAMGGSMVEGILSGNLVPSGNLVVSDPSQAILDRFSKRGVRVTSDNREAASGADIVMVVVKPWLVEDVLGSIRDLLIPSQILVSVAAGITGENLQNWTGAVSSLFLAIPNIAIAQQASMTFLTPVKATEEDKAKVVDIFNGMGKTLICDELHLKAGMALASCGIAYAFRYIRAASEGGVELGFKAKEAQEIVAQTMLGAVKLLEAEGLHPEEAIDRVTTPGGVTIKGLNAMEREGFTNAVIEGLKASVK